ncbi:MAG: hypothetical protein JXD22_15060 [Sedimentisphaerales bacterium]|nr:hypothetical protein [Sedimentisphaerales bacterium]
MLTYHQFFEFIQRRSETRNAGPYPISIPEMTLSMVRIEQVDADGNVIRSYPIFRSSAFDWKLAPISDDVISSICNHFNIVLSEVWIYELEKGNNEQKLYALKKVLGFQNITSDFCRVVRQLMASKLPKNIIETACRVFEASGSVSAPYLFDIINENKISANVDWAAKTILSIAKKNERCKYIVRETAANIDKKNEYIEYIINSLGK